MPTLTDLLNSLAFLGQQPAAWGIVITALVLVVINDWRWSLAALATQYIITGWLLSHVLEPQIAMLKILVGFMICLVLYLTARQVNWGRSPDKTRLVIKVRWGLTIGFTFRLFIGLLFTIIIMIVTNNQTVSLPELPPYINLASLSLMTMGMLALGLSDEPLMAGMGLLTALSGFELFYHSLEQAITVIGFLVGIDFFIALVTAYMTTAQHWSQEDAEKEQTL
ncbi:MAG: hypothetical protein JXA42_15740 [Anaerolineales bacterium]|nr:hypothetical protein [Anaerolineales bacterium]